MGGTGGGTEEKGGTGLGTREKDGGSGGGQLGGQVGDRWGTGGWNVHVCHSACECHFSLLAQLQQDV